MFNISNISTPTSYTHKEPGLKCLLFGILLALAVPESINLLENAEQNAKQQSFLFFFYTENLLSKWGKYNSISKTDAVTTQLSSYT